ncbi:MAG: hypothetical protein KatS3mg019_2381 [Fimbriimonadales bacterium]|nr:MAG: hypothetical protein KatS3mg019_2381 [Fimbriimonadales bacterium]
MKGLTTFRALSAMGLATAAIATSAAQTQLVFWDFNESNPLDETAMLAADGGVFASQAQLSVALAVFRFNNSGSGFRGSPQDPNNSNHPNPPNWALQTTSYPAQGENSGQAGVVVSMPTTGYKDIIVKFDVRWSNTSSKYLAVEYTTDGGLNWTRVRTLEAKRGDRWHSEPDPNGYGELVQIDLSADASVNNNAQFAFRVVTIFDPATNQYTAANFPNNPSATYSSNGTLRYDLIEVLGTEVSSGPEGDVNGDGCVDDADLLVVLFNFGNEGGQGDVNSDNIVDDADLLVVLFNFGAGCGG